MHVAAILSLQGLKKSYLKDAYSSKIPLLLETLDLPTSQSHETSPSNPF
jgi:hypothetical protein